ncbi:MAG: glycolate oxidase subunit GlcE [Shimia sp.]|nr:glycolate oxidase subunit GlcE [Shimia sp.]
MTAFATPTTESAIKEAVCDAVSQKKALRVCGGGTRSGIGQMVENAERLDVSGNAGIELYEPGSLTMVARAGTSMTEITSALDAENQMLAFEPIDHRPLLGTTGEPTLGGVVACNISGPRRFLSGACRDHLLGVRFIDGQGRLVKNGGRVMKNVTGLDLTKLMCGSFGTLGVISEVSLKVLPKPVCSASLQIEGVDEEQAVLLFCKALTTPYEVSGAAYQNGVAVLRIEGLETQVTYRIARLQALFPEHSMSILDGEVHSDLWKGLRDLHLFSGTIETVWRMSVKPTDAPAIVSHLKRKLAARVMLDHGGGTIWAGVPADITEQAASIRSVINTLGGHATLVRGSEELRRSADVFQPQATRLAAISKLLRQQFDPSGILNPGLMAA